MIRHTIDCRINQKDKIPVNSPMSPKKKKKKVLKWKKKKLNLQIVVKQMGKPVFYIKQKSSEPHN